MLIYCTSLSTPTIYYYNKYRTFIMPQDIFREIKFPDTCQISNGIINDFILNPVTFYNLSHGFHNFAMENININCVHLWSQANKLGNRGLGMHCTERFYDRTHAHIYTHHEIIIEIALKNNILILWLLIN